MFYHLHEDIQAYARQQYPKEACGLILKKDQEEYFLPCENEADDPKNSFTISDRTVIENYDNILSVVHSHCDEPPIPSIHDQESQAITRFPYGILSVISGYAGDVYFWGRTEKNNLMDLIGKPYIWKIHDCLTLVQDYYRSFLDIDFPDFVREPGNQKTIYRKIRNCTHDFEQVSERQTNDLIFFPDECHLGIYLGNGELLHHPGDDEPFSPCNLSRREPFSEVTAYTTRHYEIWRYVK